ncbi:TPA: hypothetical protein N0F65_011637 [Lagenidium giganteum]|uniref:Uncharacterized protein n=1 Tax=Lagenidium giganteum TaxID=4803 RepID=A0AAV2Z8K7_9STRA|nr:TPA: hypothetical protein N0F65_011637 [Lagenidium giganteum]
MGDTEEKEHETEEQRLSDGSDGLRSVSSSVAGAASSPSLSDDLNVAPTPSQRRQSRALGLGWPKAVRNNTSINRIMQAALLKTLIHAIRSGSVEGVRVAIERGVAIDYVDNKQRNLIMFATKCDTDSRLRIVIILADAGCDINHSDHTGWSCLHYACANGAQDVAVELVRRGARADMNPYGYGPEDFITAKVARAKSLLQHTEQLQHETNVKLCWEYFRRQAEKSGYAVKCESHCDLGKPLKVAFEAPAGHSTLDRIRVIDLNSDTPLWLQVSKNFSIPPGDVGTITLDAETLDRPSLYRIFYEKYEPTPVILPPEVTENNLCIKNLDTGSTVSMGSVNELVLNELHSARSSRSSRSSRGSKHFSSSTREDNEPRKSIEMRRKSTTRRREVAESEGGEVDDSEEESECDYPPIPERTSFTEPVVHPAVTSITGVYKTVAMATVSVSTLERKNANEYEIVVKNPGPIGLHLEPMSDASKRLIVRRSSGQAAAVSPGDLLVAIGSSNIEHAGLKHTLWELNEAERPIVLRFRRGNNTEKRSLFATIRRFSGSKPVAAIAV